jgi:hypothetical protein
MDRCGFSGLVNIVFLVNSRPMSSQLITVELRKIWDNFKNPTPLGNRTTK